jgi:hypothetical protein
MTTDTFQNRVETTGLYFDKIEEKSHRYSKNLGKKR